MDASLAEEPIEISSRVYYKDAIIQIDKNDPSRLKCRTRQDVQEVIQQTLSLSKDAMREDAITAFVNKKPLKENVWTQEHDRYTHPYHLRIEPNDVTQYEFFLNYLGDPQFNISLLESSAEVTDIVDQNFYQGVIYTDCVITFEGRLWKEMDETTTRKTNVNPFGVGKLYDKWGVLLYTGDTTPSGKNGRGLVYYPDGKTPMMSSFFYCGQDEPTEDSTYYDDKGQKLPADMEHDKYVAKRVKETHQCSYMFKRDIFTTQIVFACDTCYASDGGSISKGCCIACSQRCHKGHNIREMGLMRGFFCDCGAGDLGYFDCCAKTPCSLGCQCREYILDDSDDSDE